MFSRCHICKNQLHKAQDGFLFIGLLKVPDLNFCNGGHRNSGCKTRDWALHATSGGGAQRMLGVLVPCTRSSQQTSFSRNRRTKICVPRRKKNVSLFLKKSKADFTFGEVYFSNILKCTYCEPANREIFE